MSKQNNFDDPNSFFDRVLTGSSNQAQFWSRRSFWGSILMTAAILVLVSVIWLSYIGAPDVSSEEQLPILRANTQDVRTAPENPGGMDIKNKESTIFNALREEAPSVPKVENLLAGRDVESVDRSGVVSDDIDLDDPDAVREAMLRKAEEHVRALKEKADGVPDRGQFPEPTADTTPEETLEYVRSVLDRKDVKTIHPVEVPVKVAPKPTPVAKPKVKSTPKPVAKKITKTVKSTAPATGPMRYVQLGSFKSQSSAQDKWAKMKKEYPDLFDGLTLRVQRADLGSKGIYYRVQAGKIAQSQAKEICAKVNAKRSGGCLVAKP